MTDLVLPQQLLEHSLISAHSLLLSRLAAEQAAATATGAVATLVDPSRWESVDPSHGNRHLLLLDAVKHAAELEGVKAHWNDTQGRGTIVSVHRVQNPSLHQRYAEVKQNLIKDGVQHQSEVIAYHGTRSNDPALIYDSKTGFDVSRGMARPGSVLDYSHCEQQSLS